MLMKAENEFQYKIINRDVRDEAGKPTNIPTLSTMYRRNRNLLQNESYGFYTA